MANNQIENTIRDWLADNLFFIEKGLQLIQKEFYLPDNIGSKGFIDLLCKDVYNNFVIIEIKRSITSSRQTMNEIFKYFSLIKHNYKARESEIRIIVLSTHWNELIRAYSEAFYKTKIALKGFEIDIDANTSIPFKITSIEPLEPILIARKFSFCQGLYFFYTEEKRNLFEEVLKQRLIAGSVEDYVLLDLDGPLKNKKIQTPYAIAAAFQRQSVIKLLKAIEVLNTSLETDVMSRNEFEDELSYQKHLEGAFIDSLSMFEYYDDVEAGYSEKL